MQNYKKLPTYTELFDLNPAAEAFLFDMDGTIVNTEALHAQAFMRLLSGESLQDVSAEDLYKLCLGQTDGRIFEILGQHGLLRGRELSELRAAKNRHYFELLHAVADHEICLPQIRNLLEDIRNAGGKLAVVTSSDRATAEATLGRMNFQAYFQFLVTEESTEFNKPHPQPYQHAAQLLEVGAEACVVFEDSPTGLEAAKSFAPGAIVRAGWYA